MQPAFLAKPLHDLTEEEWESLCDGCGLCCQVRERDEDTGEIALSNIACRYLDLCTHRCSDYANRHKNVPDCIKVTPENVRELHWLPMSCAYRLVAAGEELPQWHHLVCGDPARVHDEEEGVSMMGCLISEEELESEGIWRKIKLYFQNLGHKS